MKTITIIDTFGFFFRAYYALPPLHNDEGFPTGLLTGFVNLVDALHKEFETDYLVFALDSEGPSFRNDIYPAYKANRESPPEDLKMQLKVAIEWIEKMGFPNLSKQGFEADDVIATVTKFARKQHIDVRIVSHDKDLYQLIDDHHVVLFDAVKKKEVDEAACIEKFGVHPKDFVDFQALVGDSSDNVPGVKGIGVKTAAKLINAFHTLENIYAHIDQAGTPRIQKLLSEGKENAFLSRELVRMRDDVFENLDLSQYVFEEKNYLACLLEDFQRLQMRQAIRKAKAYTPVACRAPLELSDDKKEKEADLTNDCDRFETVILDDADALFEVINALKKDTIVAFDTETTSLDTKEAEMVGFSFCFDESKAYYVPVAHNYLGVGRQISLNDAKKALQSLMKCRIVGQNLKFDLSLLYERFGFGRMTPFADTMILAWLRDPGSKVGLDALAKRYFNYEMQAFASTVKKGENFSSVPIEEAAFYAAEDAWMTFKLYKKLKKELEMHSLSHLLKEARQVEYPFINVLIGMERAGIKADIDRLETLKGELSSSLEALTRDIYALSGTEFNIRSTQQLGHVLFETLGLKGGKKTKTGYSTNETVLQSLKDAHPVIEKILAYREVQKMLSTYVEPLLKLAKADAKGRIHTSFLQTGTATGRLASKDPNLQNIPVRSELGRKVRDVFVAEAGYRLVSIDYSQIELRLLAHFSGDKALCEAFRKGEDIHRATAVKLFGEAEADAKRNIAKSINFGLLYGMGPKKLSAEIGVSMKEAKAIIENYFATFPTVKRYLESIQEHMRTEGYVETLLGRRRFFDYDNANGMQKAAYLRESVNTVFQGSAADLIKLAMNAIDAEIVKKKLPATMLLQIHDELIFEIVVSEAEKIAARFKKMMENIYALDVPLVCSVSIAESWGKLK